MTNKTDLHKIYDKLKSAIRAAPTRREVFSHRAELETLYQVSTTIRKAVKLLSDEGIFKCAPGCARWS